MFEPRHVQEEPREKGMLQAAEQTGANSAEPARPDRRLISHVDVHNSLYPPAC